MDAASMATHSDPSHELGYQRQRPPYHDEAPARGISNEREVAGTAPQGSPRESRSEWTNAPNLDALRTAPLDPRGNPSYGQRPSRPPHTAANDSSDAVHSLAALSAAAAQQSHAPAPRLAPVDGDSQNSINSLESEKIFSPSASQSDASGLAEANGHASSHDSQLLQLSQLAAAQDKMAGPDAPASSVPARKRMADGEVKPSNRSPVRGGHSRNTSTVSVASNASTIGDLSNDLKTRLSYAMVKVNYGWQSRSIEEVESMASRAASPASSHSTFPGPAGSSASPRMAFAARNGGQSATASSSNPSPAAPESFWKDSDRPVQKARQSVSPPAAPSQKQPPALAPPASIQPSRPTVTTTSRRNSNPHYTPAWLPNIHPAATAASPHSPAHYSPFQATPDQRTTARRTPAADPMLLSPHQNVREQDAIETLLFMSSPGNSANMKHGYAPATSASSAQQPTPGARHALPTSQPRKGLPNQRPQQNTPKRVGFEKSPGSVSDMDVDGESQAGTPRSAARRRINGGNPSTQSPGHFLGHRSQLSLPAGLGSGHARPRPRLADADIERMLDRVAQQAENDSSDDDEIQIPERREEAGIAG